MVIHQRLDIEMNFRSVINSVYENELKIKNFLLLIDGPIENSFQKLIYELKSHHSFDVYQHPNNIGLANMLNIGLKKINTKWIIRADGDDINLANRFKILVENLNESYSVIGSFSAEMDEKDNYRLKRVPVTDRKIKSYAKFRNPFNHNTVIYQKKHVLEVGGYPNLYLKEDYGLWIKLISKKFNFYNIPEVLVHASFDKSSYKRRAGFKYLISDLQIIKLKYSEGLINIFELILMSLLKLFFAILPLNLKILIYKTIRSFS